MSKIITEFESRHEFLRFLQHNPGFIVVKFGASWCGPCKNIEPGLQKFFSKCPANVVCCDIDVDASSDLHSFMKSKKMVPGVPAVLVWEQGNTSFAPDYSHMGGDVREFTDFANSMLGMMSE